LPHVSSPSSQLHQTSSDIIRHHQTQASSSVSKEQETDSTDVEMKDATMEPVAWSLKEAAMMFD
jgi:hypothetical protein